jgi:hypothetical protein
MSETKSVAKMGINGFGRIGLFLFKLPILLSVPPAYVFRPFLCRGSQVAWSLVLLFFAQRELSMLWLSTILS